MELLPNRIYHIYNRGNDKQPIFFNRENYLFFLKKMRTHLLPTCDFLAYCLMPNHFHFMIKTDERSVVQVTPQNKAFNQGLGTMLSSYARAIQKQEGLVGSLFQQRTDGKQVSSEWSWEDYTLICFRYILNNPVKAKLVTHPADWEFSSYRDTAGLRNGTLCSQRLIHQELALDLTTLEDIVGQPLTEEELRKIM